MKLTETELPGVVQIEPQVFGDDRGYFFETFRTDRYCEEHLKTEFLQDNVSFSKKGVLRGLHFQNPKAQGKLVYVLSGEIFDVAVDIRPSSPQFGKWVGRNLSDKNHSQLFVPPGFAHGFLVLSDSALVQYKCTSFYSPESEWTLRWDDPTVKVAWPVAPALISPKDGKAFSLEQLFAAGRLPD